MELNVMEQKKDRMVFELKGEGHSFCNALKRELWNDKKIKAAGYTIRHPLVAVPKVIVETDGSKRPEEALKEASKSLKKKADSFSKEFKKIVK